MEFSELQDFKTNVRMVLAALWTTVMFCYIYGDYFELYVPKKIQGLLTIPALMISLSLLLKPKFCRWVNICVGLFFTLFTLLVGITSISQWTMLYVFLSFLESILTTIIVWRAWTWKKVKAFPLT